MMNVRRFLPCSSFYSFTLIAWSLQRALRTATALTTRDTPHGGRTCGTPDTSMEERDLMRITMNTFRAQIERGDLQRSDIVTIPVCFFVLTDSEGKNDHPDEMFQAQLDYTNVAFSNQNCCDDEIYDWCEPGSCSVETGFRFAWQQLGSEENPIPGATVPNVADEGACLIRVENTTWAEVSRGTMEVDEMRTTLRKGGRELLNTYWTSIRSGDLGFANLPYSYKGPNDGVVMLSSTIKGGTYVNFNEGDTFVHEVSAGRVVLKPPTT